MEEMGDLFGDEVVVHMSKEGNYLVDLKKELTNVPDNGEGKELPLELETVHQV